MGSFPPFSSSHLGEADVADIEELPAEGEYTVVVAAHHGEATDSEGLGGVTLGEDQSALLRLLTPRVVRVVELGDARDGALLSPARLLHPLHRREVRVFEDGLDESALHKLLEELEEGRERGIRGDTGGYGGYEGTLHE